MKVRPNGGPPDTIPAKVIQTIPASGTTNVTEDGVTFTFDDYVDRSIRSSISIQPRTRISTSYAGDEITVSFTEPLSPNTTYSITIGTDWRDLRGNQPLEAYGMIFSTGSAIDTGTISGTVQGMLLKDVVVLCYSHADTLPADFSPSKTEAAYVVPLGSSGAFTVRGLPDGTYRIIAAKDENKNYLVDASEAFGTATGDIQVVGGISAPQNLMLGNPIDVTSPQLVVARSLSSVRHYASFSEPLVVLPDGHIEVVDSSGHALNVKRWWVSKQQPERLVFITDPATPTTTYTVSISNNAVTDTSGNISLSANYASSMRTGTQTDTTGVSLLKTSIGDSAKDVSITQPLVVAFSDGINTATARVSATVQTLTKTMSLTVNWLNALEFECVPPSPLTPSAWYEFAVQISNVTSVAGKEMPDTIIRLSFQTTDRVDSGSVSGRFVDSAGFGGPYLLQFVSKQGMIEHSMTVTNNSSFNIPAIISGDYTVRVIQDINLNGRFDHGNISPFRRSEKWFLFPVNLTIKKRWALEDVVLSIR